MSQSTTESIRTRVAVPRTSSRSSHHEPVGDGRPKGSIPVARNPNNSKTTTVDPAKEEGELGFLFFGRPMPLFEPAAGPLVPIAPAAGSPQSIQVTQPTPSIDRHLPF